MVTNSRGLIVIRALNAEEAAVIAQLRDVVGRRRRAVRMVKYHSVSVALGVFSTVAAALAWGLGNWPWLLGVGLMTIADAVSLRDAKRDLAALTLPRVRVLTDGTVSK
jgi:hypothetical protein